jgi:glycosyltransferase involved in cell wall biosynthesis
MPAGEMQTVPRVSVIVTTFNSAATIKRTVESIQAQTMDDFEIVIVDDASTDDTVRVVESILEPRLRLVQNSHNRGIGGAKNVGVENARGQYIAFLDSDDTWEQTKLALQLAALSAVQDISPLSFTAFWVHRAGSGKTVRRQPRRYGTWLQSILIGETLSLGSTLLATRRCFETVGGFNEGLRRLQDRDWTLRYFRYWDDFEYIDTPLSHIFNVGFPKPELVRASVDNLFALHEDGLRQRDPVMARTFRSSLDFEVAVAKYRSGDFAGASRTLLQAWTTSPGSGWYFVRRAVRKVMQGDLN